MVWLATLSLAVLLIKPAHAQDDAGLQAIIDLAEINGQALACQQLSTATRAKSLMLLHAPKTARFGAAFDEGTHHAFIVQTSGSTPCPDATTLTAKLVNVTLRLQTTLPPVQPFEPKPITVQ